MDHLLDELSKVTEFPVAKEFEGDVLSPVRRRLSNLAGVWKSTNTGDEMIFTDVILGNMPTSANLITATEPLSESGKLALAWSHVNQGNELMDDASLLKGKAASSMYMQAYQQYAAAVEVKPDLYEAWNNWGTALSNEAMLLEKESATSKYKEAYQKFATATAINPNRHDAWYNWGTVLSDEAKLVGKTTAISNCKIAYEKFATALAIKPDKHQALHNWGNTLAHEAKLVKGQLAISKYEEAYAKYAKAIAIKPSKYETFSSWGSELTHEADLLKSLLEKDAAILKYKEAYEKYAAAIAINPDEHNVLSNWACALINEAHLLERSDRIENLKSAEKKLQRASAITGKASYHLACYYSMTGNHSMAINELLLCQIHGTLPDKAFLEADTNLSQLRGMAEFNALLSSLD
jgi:tetratricopeptide (TPR) repeat protein